MSGEYHSTLFKVKCHEKIQTQLWKDIPRTFRDLDIPSFRESGSQNPLYKLLAVFSVHNPDIGYCQGMNYLASLILIGVDMKEDLAYTIFVKLMRDYKL